jgi:Na+/melibiose symporter-like transporter
LLFAIAALLQKVTMGVAVAVFGVLLSAAGYVARDVQPPEVLRALALLTVALPLGALVVAAAAMLPFPARLNARLPSRGEVDLGG